MVSERHANVLVAELVSRRRCEANIISPESVATEIMIQLDPIHPKDDVYGLAHAMLKQIARGILNRRFGSEVDDSGFEQLDMFPLQDFYPQAIGEGYIARHLMTDEDIAYNVARLRKEAGTKLRHADGLEAWGIKRHWDKQPS